MRDMHQRAILGSGWARGGASEVVRRACPASGAQWNVQVVRGKVNGKCLWNACKALSLGLLLMVLGAAMATIGYYAERLSIAEEVRGNYTISVKNESRGFHLNNLSYAGPIVMGVGGFIIVAACVMTFEARDSAAKVVPARFKLSTTGPPSGAACGHYSGHSAHNSLRHSSSQTGPLAHTFHQCGPPDRRALTQSFQQFSRGLALDHQRQRHLLKTPQCSLNKSPSAPDLVAEGMVACEKSPNLTRRTVTDKVSPKSSRKACPMLNPRLLHRHALSVDETAHSYRGHETLHGGGSQGSMALDLHLEYPVTLRIRDQRRNPLKRQRKVEEDEKHHNVDNSSRRSSHSCSPRIPSAYLRENASGGSAQQLTSSGGHAYSSSHRRSSNASDCTQRSSRSRRRECIHTRGKLERAISSDSRLTGATPKCRHHYTPTQTSTEDPPQGALSDSDLRHSHRAMVHFSNETVSIRH